MNLQAKAFSNLNIDAGQMRLTVAKLTNATTKKPSDQIDIELCNYREKSLDSKKWHVVQAHSTQENALFPVRVLKSWPMLRPHADGAGGLNRMDAILMHDL